MKTQITIAISLLILSLGAQARREEHRANRQERRIEQGTQNGSLTEEEARRLERGQRHVQNAESKAEADGHVTRKEKLKIERMQDVQSARIYRQKHDRQTANSNNSSPASSESSGQ